MPKLSFSDQLAITFYKISSLEFGAVVDGISGRSLTVSFSFSYLNSLSGAKKARPQNRKHRTSRNPVKMLAERRDIQSEYTEQIYGVAEREMKRIKTEQSRF